ncbi:ferritin-like domain-containing protein [Hymenobacter convexus]|uniref:ferritin-like domain-containing protein n=1 Tax=Hymenobacter sp. CA1UV-4 TaxID=3063782 RepID=UPI0027134F23|nr:ferritin-like domain-containing protein [Hymenobacter sp. CA1UV-4]MDO7850154.1 ferritin-like domain-containing protein [Hymenobacter sp. CA1UV-4]
MSDNLQPRGSDDTSFAQPLYTPIKRRSFFMYAGATAGATALVLAGCSKDNDPVTSSNLINVGSGDTGVLNYAYALEQLEAGFYTRLRTGTYYTGLGSTSAEKQILDDLYYHEVIHREFFKAAITSGRISDSLTPDFSKVDFNSRTSVLGTAMAFEDLGVAAYNGAGQYIASPLYLTLAGKIVSVEARHAAIIRDLVGEATFVGNDVVTLTTANTSGVTTNNAPANSSLERSKSPAEVVATANTFLAEGSKLDVSGLK